MNISYFFSIIFRIKGGGDWGLMNSFVRAVHLQDQSILSCTVESALESHLLCFLAEKSRRHATVEYAFDACAAE